MHTSPTKRKGSSTFTPFSKQLETNHPSSCPSHRRSPIHRPSMVRWIGSPISQSDRNTATRSRDPRFQKNSTLSGTTENRTNPDVTPNTSTHQQESNQELGTRRSTPKLLAKASSPRPSVQNTMVDSEGLLSRCCIIIRGNSSCGWSELHMRNRRSK